MDRAVQEFLRLEKEANATPQGADSVAILRDVAARHGVAPVDLIRAVNDATIMGPI